MVHQFVVNISKTEGKPVLLSTLLDFSNSYVLVGHLPNFPKPLTDLELFDPIAMILSYPELLQQCEELYKNYGTAQFKFYTCVQAHACACTFNACKT